MSQQKNASSYTYEDILHECRRYICEDLDAEKIAKKLYETGASTSGVLLSKIIREDLEALKEKAPPWDCLPDIMLKVWPENPRGIPEASVTQILKPIEESEAAAKAFESLLPQQTLFLKMRAVDGLSIKEMASSFHMSPNEVAEALEAGREAFWHDFFGTLSGLYHGKLLSHARRRIGANSYEGTSFEDASGEMFVKLMEDARRIEPLNFGAWLTQGVKWEAGDIEKKYKRHRNIGRKYGDTEIAEDDPEPDEGSSSIARVLSSPSEMRDPEEQLITEEEFEEKYREIEKTFSSQNDCLKAFLEELMNSKKPTELLFVFIRYYLNNSPVIADFDKGLIPAHVTEPPLDIAEGLAVDDLAQKQARTEYALKPLSQASIAAAIGISEKTIQRRYEELRERLAHCCQQFGIEISQFDALGQYQQLIQTNLSDPEN